MAEFAAMEVSDRAAALGMTVRGYYELARADCRVVNPAALWLGGADRLKSWIDRQRPLADVLSLAFNGPPRVERMVRDFAAMLPAPHLEHLCRRTTSVVIDTVGVCLLAPTLRIPTDDRPHVIALVAEGLADDELLGVWAHEAAHSWTAAMVEQPERDAPEVASRRIESLAYRATAIERQYPGEADGLVADLLLAPALRREHAADQLASLWLGRAFDSCGPERVLNTQARIAELADAGGRDATARAELERDLRSFEEEP